MRRYIMISTPEGDFALDVDAIGQSPMMPDMLYELVRHFYEPEIKKQLPTMKKAIMPPPAAMPTPKGTSIPKVMMESGGMAEASEEEAFEMPEDFRFKNTKVHRDGDRIILPENMTYEEAHIVLRRQEDAEEKKVAIHDQIPCYPLDGIVSFMRAIQEVYGFSFLEDTPDRWGIKHPPVLIQVPTADGKFETAPLGRIAIPKWEGGFLETQLSEQPELIIHGEVKKKFEDEVKRVITLARNFLQRGSIYRGKAISIDLSFMGIRPFIATNDAPTFMDVSRVDPSNLILNEVTEFELSANIFTLVEQTEACLRNKIPLKHGCLLMGPYGTGKTLTANVLAHKCVRHGWTFIYLKNSAQLAGALRLAQMYAPAVVFTEDIDQVMGQGRNGYINQLLNTLDGIDTKDKPIITILTTNEPEKIEPAFLRAGRIDTVISMDAPDEKTSIRFVEKFARDDSGESLLVPGIELTEVGIELKGFAPAFITEAVQKAKRFAIHREGPSIIGRITAHDLVLAAQALKKHNAMVNRKAAKTDQELVARAVQITHDYGKTGKVKRQNGEMTGENEAEKEEAVGSGA